MNPIIYSYVKKYVQTVIVIDPSNLILNFLTSTEDNPPPQGDMVDLNFTIVLEEV